MPTERERKFIANVDQVSVLTEGLHPADITQHYLSSEDSINELRIRQTAHDRKRPTYRSTLKNGRGEYRDEVEVSLLTGSFTELSKISIARLTKRRYDLGPGLTLDTYLSGPKRFYSTLEIEQSNTTGDIGLFDPEDLGVGSLIEVTGVPLYTSRNLATRIEQNNTMPPTITLDQAYDFIDAFPNADTHVVTLSGPSGSGKTTILDQFHTRYGENYTTISTDDYYIGKRRMRTHMPHGHETNFDHPDAIDIKRLASDIVTLKAGNPITKPIYDMKSSEPSGLYETVIPNDIIIIEGIAANLPAIRQLSDLSLTLSAPVEERLRRRIARDITRKGQTPEQVLSIFMNHVEPSYQKYFAKHDAGADYTVRSGE